MLEQLGHKQKDELQFFPQPIYKCSRDLNVRAKTRQNI